MTPPMRLDKWIAHLRSGRSLYYLADLCKLSGLSSASARRAAERLSERGVLKKVRKALYVNALALPSLQSLSVHLYQPSYVSFESALFQHGIIEQAPFVLTCATTRASKEIRTAQGTLYYHHIKAPLFFGYHRVGDYFIAEPEKAALDFIYLKRKNGEPVSLDEWHGENLSRRKLKCWALAFPKSVQRELKCLQPVR